MDELESDLCDLAQQHRDERGILPSIEFPHAPSPTPNSGSPEVHDGPDDLPTLTGMIVTYSFLILFTFNPNIKKIKSEPGANPDDDEMGIRYIARFDFSDASMDVWNALSLAIVCMMLRKIQLEIGAPIVDHQKVKRKWKSFEETEDPDL